MVYEVNTKAYLYSRWRGRLEVFEGTVTIPKHLSRRDHGRFVVGQGRKQKHMRCHEEPKVVFHNTVWMTERDDELARKLFIEYEQECLKKAKETIKYHKQNIKTLETLEVTNAELSNL